MAIEALQADYERKLREYECVHAQWVNTSIFTEQGKALKARLAALSGPLSRARALWSEAFHSSY